MKTLIVDDDFTSQALLQTLLSPFGECQIATDGKEALHALDAAYRSGAPFDLICLDIMMPEMDGQETLRHIRYHEASFGMLPGKGSKILMTTALGDATNILTAFQEASNGYLVKPIKRHKLISELKRLGLILPSMP